MKKITYDFFYQLSRLTYEYEELDFILDLLDDEDIQIAQDYADEIIAEGTYLNLDNFVNVCDMLDIHEEMIEYIIDKSESFMLLSDISTYKLTAPITTKLIVKMFNLNEQASSKIWAEKINNPFQNAHNYIFWSAVFMDHKDLYDKINEYSIKTKKQNIITKQHQTEAYERNKLKELLAKYPDVLESENNDT